MVQILNIVEDDAYSQIPLLEVDKYLSGILSEDDVVELFPYNLPTAEKITIGLSKKKHIGITKGNWTSTLNELYAGKPYDYGDKIKGAINIGDKTIQFNISDFM